MTLSELSIKRLKGVNPKLQAVIILAAMRADFRINVSEGVRSQERQNQMYAEGKSKTKKGKHLIQADGYGAAVDIYPITFDGKAVDWDKFDDMVKIVKAAAAELGYSITCGHEWTSFKDSPHFELKS